MIETNVLWSILICTLVNREEQFIALQNSLIKQIEENNLVDKVELIYFQDDRDFPVGMKRNKLIEDSSGKYISFIDDDDRVSDTYIKSVYDLLEKNSDIDCIGIKGKLISKDLGDKEFIHSLRYKKYSEDDDYYYRPPNHLNILKKEIVEKFEFPIVSFGEDTDWAMRICKANALKTEVFLNEVIYYYYFNYNTSETQRRIVYE